ncbi:MAG: T9SS type A sorting domain-containing protein, partial [candidate division Zixibacteria bacterium]|nr:T9SS type A sorting domain-containing protein [candidate division Zixibacteria bacterium]
FPNPFNPTTEIEFALPKLAHVRLEIYNIMGQKIVTLIDTQLDAGYHSIMWNAGNAATGLYFYRLQADEFVDTKKMLLMK